MQRIRGLYQSAADAFNRRALRERILLGLTLLVVVAVLWHLLFFRGQQQRVERLREQTGNVREQIVSLQSEREDLLQRVREGAKEELRREKERLEKELKRLDQEMREKSRELISPREMTRHLRDVLRDSADLELVELANQPPSQVEPGSLIDSSRKLQNANLPDLYRHPLLITFKGSYPQAVRAFSKLQEMSPRFFWDSLQYTVEEHPVARLHLRVHTLSLDKAWIGF